MLPVPVTLGNFSGLHAAGHPSRPRLLFVHGAFSCPLQLLPLLDACSEAGFNCYAFPLRGHATGERVNGAGIAEYVMDVLAMIRQLGGEPPILIGHSMGGLVTLKVAETGNARAVVLVSAAPPAPVMATWHSLPAFLRLLPRVLLGAPIDPPREILRRVALNRVDPALHQPILDTFVPESGAALRDIMLGLVKVTPGKVRVPLLYLIGARDRLVPAWQMRSAAKRLGATVHEYPEGGHSLFVEQHGDEVRRRMIGWLEQQSGHRVIGVSGEVLERPDPIAR